MLIRICRVSAATVSCAGAPVAGLSAAMPEIKTKSPPRTAGDSGKPDFCDWSSAGFLSSITCRDSVISTSPLSFCGGHVEHDLEPGLDLHSHDGGGGEGGGWRTRWVGVGVVVCSVV